MIEQMKQLCIVSTLSAKKTMLVGLRNLGVVHIKQKKTASTDVAEHFSSVSFAYTVLSELKTSSEKNAVLKSEDFEKLHKSVLRAIEEKKICTQEKTKIQFEIEKIKAWGDFSPEDILKLRDRGISLFFYRLGKKEIKILSSDENTSFVRLSPVDKMETVAVLNKPLDSNFASFVFEIPEKSLSTLKRELKTCIEKIQKSDDVLEKASKYLSSYKAQLIQCENEVEFSSVERTTDTDETLVWLCGYIPVSEIDNFKSFAKKNNYAFVLSDIEKDDEFVPTKLKYGKLSKLISPVMDLLGTVPGYTEYDISFWFLCFFSLFFSMIIGDAGYGLCFLIIAFIINLKNRKVTNVNVLLYVISATTIIWGVLTGTWFGLEGAMKIGFLKKAVIPSLANFPQYFGNTETNQQNTMIRFCFSIGAVQLSLACIISIIHKIKEKNLSFVADIGWLLSINSLYFVVLLLVIGEQTSLKNCAIIILLGFVLICLFGGMSSGVSFSKGLKAGLAGTFTNFLNIVSAFGNVMSYIRLFAVGLSSLAIAQSFNSMALNMNGALKIVGILIFMVGHLLNIIMGLLSVMVHGVRLNLLEFSGQLGMQWSGTSYNPFRIITK